MRVSSIWLTHPSNERKEEGGIGRARDQGERPNSSVNIASSVDRRLHVNELASTIGQKSRTSLLLASHREKSSFSRKFVARFLPCQRNVLSTIRIPNVYLPFDHVTNKHTFERNIRLTKLLLWLSIGTNDRSHSSNPRNTSAFKSFAKMNSPLKADCVLRFE